jgi:hypothetical protein
MGEQCEKGRVRRTRGPASVKRTKTTTAINGEWYPTLQAALNALSASVRQLAASVDASGASAATAANSPAAGTDHRACAEVAGSRNRKEAKPRVPSEHEKVPPGMGAMPENRAAFAEAVFARVDLVGAWTRLVNCEDEKIVQRALEKLDEMKYEASASSDEPERFVSHVPRPQRD